MRSNVFESYYYNNILYYNIIKINILNILIYLRLYIIIHNYT